MQGLMDTVLSYETQTRYGSSVQPPCSGSHEEPLRGG